MKDALKRFLLSCLGMLLLGTAGVLILHKTVDAPTPARAQDPDDDTPRPLREARPPVGSAHFKELIPALLAALTDPDGNVRQMAAATLVLIGGEAVGPLTQALGAKDKETRANGAYVLGQLGEQAEEALPALAKALKDQDADVRRRVAFAIYHIVNSGGGNHDGMNRLPPVATTMMPGGPRGPSMVGIAGMADPGLLVPATPLPVPPPR